MRNIALFLSLSTPLTTQALLVPTPVKPPTLAYATPLPRIFPRDNELASNKTFSGPCCEDAGGCCPSMTVCVFEGCCRVGETCPPGTILSASSTSSKHTSSSSSTDVGFPTDIPAPTTSSRSSINQNAIIAGCVVGGILVFSAAVTAYKKHQQRRVFRLQKEANDANLKAFSPVQQQQPQFMPLPPTQPSQMGPIISEPETPFYPPPRELTMPLSLHGQTMTWQRTDSTTNLNLNEPAFTRPSILPPNYHSPLPWT